MEKIAKYRQIVRELLIAHATTNEPNIECQLIYCVRSASALQTPLH